MYRFPLTHMWPFDYMLSVSFNIVAPCLYLQLQMVGATSAPRLEVEPTVRRTSGGIDSNVTLTCVASAKPVLCLWKTPYGHIYTLSDGVFAEAGRLQHHRNPVSETSDRECSVQIVGLQERDSGGWSCEVGAVIDNQFLTESASVDLQIKSKPPCVIFGIWDAH